MDPGRLRQVLERMGACRVAVMGDFCLDAYWTLRPDSDERSIETGRPVRQVVSQRYSLGGAGNVIANLAALGVADIRAFGVIGDDPFGRELVRLLVELNVRTDGLIVQAANWDTPTYCKPHLGDEEQDRIDFGAANALSPRSADAVLAGLTTALPHLDAVILNQQLANGLWTELMLSAVGRLDRPAGLVCVADSRHRIGRFDSMVWKLNLSEAARLLGEQPVPASRDGPAAVDQARRLAGRIVKQNRQPVLVTLGEQGNIVADRDGVHTNPPVPVAGPVDPVGAGDTAVAAFTTALAAGATPAESACIANLAASVTVTKLRQTGTATPDEILAVSRQVPRG